MRASDILHAETPGAKLIRALLGPAASLFGVGVGIRNSLYDARRLRIDRAAIPVISIGNISVGGTGKTPFCAWLAAHLENAGHKPAIILRGYGDDEPLVHQRLNPSIRVIVDPVRLRGVEAAQLAGATVAVLDDGFQHRRISRDADIVLVSSERWNESMSLLPAGDLREPVTALGRADLVVVTRKAASREKALSVEKAIRRRFGNMATAIAYLTPGSLRDSAGNEIPLAQMSGRTVLAISAVGDNRAFESQLGILGAELRIRSYPDHHPFSKRDVSELAKESGDAEFTICTLKDAVKLWPEWPASAKPLWYVSQALVLESGAGAIDDLIARVAPAQPK